MVQPAEKATPPLFLEYLLRLLYSTYDIKTMLIYQAVEKRRKGNVDEDISEVKRSYRKNDEVKEVREFIE